MPYHPIESYGVIGNMRTAALVSTRGSMDWLCYPRFDSPSVFAAILDDRRGGRFVIAPANEGAASKQFYWPDTNVLVTRFLSPEGVAEIEDLMPVGRAVDGANVDQVVRRVKVSRGGVAFELRCEPAFDYGRRRPAVSLVPQGAVFSVGAQSLALLSPVQFAATAEGVAARFVLKEGQRATFVLMQVGAGPSVQEPPTDREGDALFEATVAFWRSWLSQCTYRGRWREIVHRSALVLKLLTYEPTGAIVAAPTCGLPELIGGVRNWDYRYTWIRDAAFTLYALLRIGFTGEAGRFMDWLDARSHQAQDGPPLQIVYGVDGRPDLPERILDHLEGYRGSRPVRVGNAAAGQLQLDIYGELMDSVYLFNKYGTPISYDLWTCLSRMLDWVCENWRRPDEGIWETRGGARHFVYSKMMCWVALDRGIRLADKRSFPANRARWLAERDTIYQRIMAEGWSPKRGSFVQFVGGDTIDASNLLMPLVFFLSPVDPRMLSMLDAVCQPPGRGGLVSDGLVYRYDTDLSPDGLDGREGTFNMCTFWLVEALTRAGRTDPRRLDQARLLFERMLGYANHLGLYAEQTGASGEALGNYPQALTHLALISAAFNLDRTLDGKTRIL